MATYSYMVDAFVCCGFGVGKISSLKSLVFSRILGANAVTQPGSAFFTGQRAYSLRPKEAFIMAVVRRLRERSRRLVRVGRPTREVPPSVRPEAADRLVQ